MEISNSILWLLFLVFDLCMVVVVYRLFGRVGLYGYIVMAIITANIQVVKLVNIFGLETTLGNIMYGSIFLCTDILNEIHGKKEANRAVWMGFLAMVLMTVYMQIGLKFTPSQFDEGQSGALASVFSFLPRITMGSMLAYLASQLLDVTLFANIKQRTEGRLLWLRNNASTLVSQAVDTTIFVFIGLGPLALLGMAPLIDSWQLFGAIWASSYVMKLIVALADTPFLYLARGVSRTRAALEG
ncbi:MAG: queuosine precursor transporter [Planctomycetales bacterium]|nr:queuosine precursor transporter [bacterium]UNM08050.1 MAG: queuosine precursor transporter [Planctomycetales bacterium]